MGKGASEVKLEGVDVAGLRPLPVDPEKIWEAVERKDKEKLDTLGSLSGLAEALEVNVETGLPPEKVLERRDQYGLNKLSEPPPVSLIQLIIGALGDEIVQMLMVAAVISIIFGMTLENPHTKKVDREKGWIEGTAILISVTVVVMTSALTDYQKAKKFEELSKDQAKKEIIVLRQGIEMTIDSTELVMGDIMVVEGGMHLVADGLLITGQDLKVSEAAMTGESDIIKKNHEKDPFFLSGTQIEEGSGRMLTIAIGMQSYQGRMKATTDEGGLEETPLQAHLAVLADKIGKIGFITAFVLVAALVLKEVILITKDGQDANASRFLGFVIVAIAIIVVAIPEGLPLAVTIALAFSMKAMMHDQCLVRILASCETMGAATAICSDKTGTLTTNTMTVVQGNVADRNFALAGFGLEPDQSTTTLADPKGIASDLGLPTKTTEEFCFSIAINSTAAEHVIQGQKVWVGNKTEQGLLGFVQSLHDYESMRRSVPDENKRQYPFHSKKKRMTTMVRDHNGAPMTLYCKGASELILEDCEYCIDADGTISDFGDAKKASMMSIITDMANQGNRTIGMAYATCNDMMDFPEDEPTLAMVFMGVLGIQDPIRSNVPGAVARCHSAGLTVRMVTGDNINTAKAIGKKCGIFSDNGWDMAMEGPAFREMYEKDENGLANLVPRLKILARSSPQDKFVLVGLLQGLGEVVGVTGDGTNDAPALKLSNVGFAMNTGTDIAKGAADMILMDDNFATVVAAIKWGRAVNDNIRKFLQFQLTVNFAAIILTVIGSLASENSEEPLNTVQLLWLNLIMDTLAALALATERPEEASLEREPVFQQAPLISRRMWTFILGHATFQSAIVLAVMFTGYKWFNCDDNIISCLAHGGRYDGVSRTCERGLQHNTVVFNTFIFMQIFNEFNGRKLYGEMFVFEGLLSRSRPFCIVFFIIVGFQVFAVLVAGDFMGTTPLKWDQWLGTVGLGMLEVFVGAAIRMIPIQEPVPEEVQAKRDREEELYKAVKMRQPDAANPLRGRGRSQSIVNDPALRSFRQGSSGVMTNDSMGSVSRGHPGAHFGMAEKKEISSIKLNTDELLERTKQQEHLIKELKEEVSELRAAVSGLEKHRKKSHHKDEVL